jgi:hypothetical protein
MITTQITDHVQQALARLLQQYRGRTLVTGLYTSLVDQIQDLENALFALDAGRQIWNGTGSPAIGEQLDQLGTIIGIGRNGLSDAEYLLFLFGKIAENFSDTTIPTILNVVAYVFQAESVSLVELFPAGIGLGVIGSPIPESLYQVAAGLIQAALGAGIQLVFTAASPSTNVFRMYAPGEGEENGFGDINNPAIGGGFIGLI